MKSNTINFDEKYTVESSFDLSVDDASLEFTNTEYASSDVFKTLMKTSIQSQFIKDDIKNYLQSQDLDKIVKETDIMFVLYEIRQFSHCNDNRIIFEKSHSANMMGSSVNQLDTIIRMYHLAIASDQKEIAKDIQNKIFAAIKKKLPEIKDSFYFSRYLRGSAKLAKTCGIFDSLKDFFIEQSINILNTNSDYLNTEKNSLLRYFLQELQEYTLLNKDIATTVQQLMKNPDFVSSDTLPIITDYVNKGLLISSELINDSKNNDYTNKIKVFIPIFVPKCGDPTEGFREIAEADLNIKGFSGIASIINMNIVDSHCQVGKTARDTHGIINQHSWYKRNKGYVLVEAMIDKKMVKAMAEKDYWPCNAINAGQTSYPTILPSSVIKTNDIISIRNGDGMPKFEKRDNPDFQNSGETITLFEVMQSSLTAEQIMNPTEENLERLIKGRRNVIGDTLESVRKQICCWACSQDSNRVAVVEFRAKKAYLEKYTTYHGDEGYIYKGVILPHDIQRIYPRTYDFVNLSANNSDVHKKFAEVSNQTGFENPLLKIQPSTNMTALFNSKTQKDLEDKVQNTSTPNATSSTSA